LGNILEGGHILPAGNISNKRYSKEQSNFVGAIKQRNRYIKRPSSLITGTPLVSLYARM